MTDRGRRVHRRPLRSLLVPVVALLLLATVACSDGGDAPTGIDLSDPAAGETSPSGRTLLEGFTEVTVIVTAADGTRKEFCLLLAEEVAARAQGLMEVVDLGDYAGMVFVFPGERTGGFFMRNTPTPLSIAFFDDDGAVVSTTDMDPCEDVEGCPTYLADAPYRLAVEVPQGDLSSMGLDDPDAVLDLLGGSCSPV